MSISLHEHTRRYTWACLHEHSYYYFILFYFSGGECGPSRSPCTHDTRNCHHRGYTYLIHKHPGWLFVRSVSFLCLGLVSLWTFVWVLPAFASAHHGKLSYVAIASLVNVTCRSLRNPTKTTPSSNDNHGSAIANPKPHTVRGQQSNRFFSLRFASTSTDRCRGRHLRLIHQWSNGHIGWWLTMMCRCRMGSWALVWSLRSAKMW